MNREIKFRAWDKKFKKMSPSFAVFGEFTLLGGVHAWQDHIAGEDLSSLERLNDLDLVQYTGLKDKNGVEIFEGDILYFVGSNGCSPSSHPYGGENRSWLGQKIIVVCNSGFFHGRHIEGYSPDKRYAHNCILSGWEMLKPYDLWNYQGWTEVVGNIYENQELLEKTAA